MKLKSAVCVCTAQFIYQPDVSRGVYIPVGTKITYKEWKRARSVEIYVPGFNGFARMSKRYFEDFFDEIS